MLDYSKASLTFRGLRLLLRGLFCLLFRIKVVGLENLPRQGGYILAGNHLSWLDPFLMLIFAPPTPRIYFTGDRHNMTRPAWRGFITQRIGGVILVEHGEHGDMLNEQVREVLHGGGVLGIFPEGTVSESETGHLLPLHKGVAHFALHSHASVVPMAFVGTKEPYLGKSIQVIIGKPLVPLETGLNSSDKDLLDRQTDAVAAAISQILPLPLPPNPDSPKILHDFFTYMFMTRQEIREAKARTQNHPS